MGQILHFIIFLFFKYSDETKIVIAPDSIYVLQFFPSITDGPVSYGDHYEGIVIKENDGGWKVDGYFYDNIPKSIIEKVY